LQVASTRGYIHRQKTPPSYARVRHIMRHPPILGVPIDPEVRLEAKDALDEGESLSAFVTQCVRSGLRGAGRRMHSWCEHAARWKDRFTAAAESRRRNCLGASTIESMQRCIVSGVPSAEPPRYRMVRPGICHGGAAGPNWGTQRL
jgi:hypothetical protein